MTVLMIGQAVRREEDPRPLKGKVLYVDDIKSPNEARGHVLLSPHGHAKIVGIDTSLAAAAHGVLAVLTKRRASATRSGCWRTGSCRTRSATCSNARLGDRRTRCAATTPASLIKRRAGPSRAGSWPRLNGIRASFLRGPASSSPTWRGRPNASSPSTISAARRSNGNLGNFMRTLVMPKTAEPWSLSSLRERSPAGPRFWPASALRGRSRSYWRRALCRPAPGRKTA